MAPKATGADRANDRPRQDQNNHTANVNDSDEDRKQYATLRALLAFKGISLHELSSGGFLIASAFNTLHCSDLAQVRAFCQRAGLRS
jgi:hypothetical protein